MTPDRDPPDGTAPTLGAMLRARRERALLTQEELAERAGLSARTIVGLETGRVRRPRVESVRLLDGLLPGGARPGPRVALVTGTGGVGKTALAVHWAYRARGRFPAGQLYVNLRGYSPGRRCLPSRPWPSSCAGWGWRPS